MRLYIHTGTYGPNLRLFQKALAKKRNKLLELGVLLPIHAGIYDHARPFMAGMRRSGWHPTKEAADFQDPATYAAFCDQALGDICVQIAQTRPKAMILTMSDLWTFCDTGEKLRRFMDHIDMFSDDVHACLHIDPPEVALHAHMVRQIKWGRREFGGAEAGLPNPESWFDAAHAAASVWSDQTGDDRAIVHCASPSYDQPAMLQLWENLLGEDAVFVRAFNAHPTSEDFHNDMRGFFALPGKIGRVELPPEADPLPSLPRLEKFLALNAELPAIEADNGNLRTPTRILRRRQRAIKGDVSGQRFEVAHVVPFLTKAPRGPWHAEPLSDGTKLTSLKAAPVDSDPLLKDIKTEVVGYYGRIRSWLRTRKLELAKLAKIKQDLGTSLSEDGQTLLNELGKDTYAKIMSGRFVPRQVNGFAANESEPPQPLAVKPVTPVPGTLIIACMKDEAPYILEWIAFHKSIGVENFLVFSNDCSDGTDRILDRLQELGHLIHHDNSVWQGKSPQQAALNRAMKMPIVKKASWLIHIDVDEFMNIKLGDGTLDEVLGAAGPEATNIAMTWRVFGHGGHDELGDADVLRTFTTCAPNYVPKPHTMWGFKTMTRNLGIYKKLSCHRPNQPVDSPLQPPKWLNGSLKDITAEAAQPGTWRSSPRTLGYDAIQLNHYALRSRSSYLIKRKRGRALHTDRTIGLNYWIRHDWNSQTDLSIQRHIPRMEAVKDSLLSDPDLRLLHDEGLAWHRARVAELREADEFAGLWTATRRTNLTDLERVAYALASDMET